MEKTIMPEEVYPFLVAQNLEDLKNAYNWNLSVTGIAEKVDTKKAEVLVDLGPVYGHLNFSDITVYPFSYYDHYDDDMDCLPREIYQMLGKNVRVKISSIKGDKVTLSRKKNLLESFEKVKKEKKLMVYVTFVTPKNVYCDVGDGVKGIIHKWNVTNTKIYGANYFFDVGDVFEAINIGVDEENHCINLNYKDLCPPYIPDTYKSGDSVICKVIKCIKEPRHGGYYCLVNANTPGIVYVHDASTILHYKDIIECKVIRAKKEGLDLEFSSFKDKKSWIL